MKNKRITQLTVALLFVFAISFAFLKWGKNQPVPNSPRTVASLPQPCQRLAPSIPSQPGIVAQPAVVAQAENLYSKNGSLTVNLSYQSNDDGHGNPLYCYVNEDGQQSPTLHLNPGDHLILNLTNRVTGTIPADSMKVTLSNACGNGENDLIKNKVVDMNATNIHYHGMNISPACHQDNVMNTAVNSGETFTYDLNIPLDESPGLYWYHPHVHGAAEAAVLGGASGALIIDGIQNLQPAVAGLTEQVLTIRDNLVPGGPAPGGDIPSWDLSINNIPVPYDANPEKSYPPAFIPMKVGERQFWRVLNGSADSILNLQLEYDGVPQSLEVVSLDSVPIGSQDGTQIGHTIKKTNIRLMPAARAEFIVTAPGPQVKSANLVTLKIDTGRLGDNDPRRPIAAVQLEPATHHLQMGQTKIPAVNQNANGRQRFEGILDRAPDTNRKIYFSEVLSDPTNADSPTQFFITVDGATPKMFAMNDPPSITTTQGAVEDWVIENRAEETHAFHIHQIHFLLLERDGHSVPDDDRQFLDLVELPAWDAKPLPDGSKRPFPTVKVRMDFRGLDVGDFVYHCHILQHEDSGMMAVIRVNPATK